MIPHKYKTISCYIANLFGRWTPAGLKTLLSLERNWPNDIFNICIKAKELRANVLTIHSSLSSKPVDPVGIILSHSSFPDPSGSQDPLGWSCLLPATLTRIYGTTISALGIPSGSQEGKSSAPLARRIWVPEGKSSSWNQGCLQEFKETARSTILEMDKKSL